MATHPVPPVDSSPTIGGGVRRHHTISAHSRAARQNSKDVISEESQEQPVAWNTDEVVDQDWVGGVGAVGEKTSLHRQSSLPTRYHRGLQNQASKSGTQTPKTVNSLAAIAGNEGDEEPWRLAEYSVDDDEHSPADQISAQHQQVIDAQNQTHNAPLSPHFGNNSPHVPSPPPATSGVRRHVSLTYGAAVGGPRKVTAGLKRSGTLQASAPHHSQNSGSPDPSEEAEEEEYAYENDDNSSAYEEEYYARQQQQQYGNNSIGRSSPWSNNANPTDWRGFGGNGNQAIDDVQRALSTLELASNQSPQIAPQPGYAYQQAGQNVPPPRFNPAHSPLPNQQPLARGVGNGNYGNGNGNKLQMSGNEYDGRKTPQSSQRGYGSSQPYGGQSSGSSNWEQPNQPTLRNQRSNTNLQYSQGGGHSKNPSSNSNGGGGASGAIPNVPQIPQQYLQQNQNTGGQSNRPGLGVSTTFPNQPNQPSIMPSGQTPVQGFVNTPIDVPSLIATKGYNPGTFDTRPAFARYFVIKSYTEDDVHKSLKYEIWSSTDPGNKRLDKAFKETSGRGPIYLFFSVNASGHFCGMAEMMTPVDYTRSSTVWASDKWKGVFKVRWIFVRDIPNINLRHIKLNNTQERKPVTNSRDTQELLPDAGQEMLRIFLTHPARTTLLQDFAFYEMQAMQKMQTTGTATPTPVLYTPQLPASTFNQNPLAYSPQIPPMMQMGMNNNQHQQGLHPQTQAMHQSVMRNPSPGPGPHLGQGQSQQPQGGNQVYGY